MRKCFFSLVLCCLLALPAWGLALPQDDLLRYGGDLRPNDASQGPRSLLNLAASAPEPEPRKDEPETTTETAVTATFPAPADVRPVGQALLPTLILGGEPAQRPAGLAPGFTTLWNGSVSLTAISGEEARTSLLGSLSLTGEFLPGTADPQAPSWGSIVPAALETGIQSLLSASAMPIAGHTLLLANQSEFTILADPEAVPVALLETGGMAANLLLDAGSALQITGPVALSDAPLVTLSLANDAMLRMLYTPTGDLPSALPLPASLSLSEGALLEITLQSPAQPIPADAPYTPSALALSSLGANQISLLPGTSLRIRSQAGAGRVFAVPQGVTDGVLQIIAGKVSMTNAAGRRTTWDNGATSFILSLRYGQDGRILAADTTGFSGSASGSLDSLGELTSLTVTRAAEVDKLPKKEEEDDAFNGWAIGVDHVYEEGGRRILIPQLSSHTVSWASKSGQDVSIPTGNFPGFAPVEANHVVYNVRKHQSYEILYVRTTVGRTATVRVDAEGLDDGQLKDLRKAARGTLRLYQEGVYQELEYKVPKDENSTIVGGTVYTHTPTGVALSSHFDMPDVPKGLKVEVRGDVFILSYAVPPTPVPTDTPAPTPVPTPTPTPTPTAAVPTAVPDVQINVEYRYSEDGGSSFPGVIPGLDTALTVQWGEDLSRLQVPLDGFTFYDMTGQAQEGETVTVRYTRNSVQVTGALDITEPASITGDPASYFSFSLMLENQPASVTPTASGNTVIADFGPQFTHTEDGAPRLGDMTCTPNWPNAQSFIMDNNGDGSYTYRTALAKYAVPIACQVNGGTFRDSSVDVYYQEPTNVDAPGFIGLDVPVSQTVTYVTGTESLVFDYTRLTSKATVTVIFSDPASLPPGVYSDTLDVTVNGETANGPESEILSFPLTEAEIQSGQAFLTGSKEFYAYNLPTQADDGSLLTSFNVSVTPILGFPAGNAQFSTAGGYADIRITYPAYEP